MVQLCQTYTEVTDIDPGNSAAIQKDTLSARPCDTSGRSQPFLGCSVAKWVPADAIMDHHKASFDQLEGVTGISGFRLGCWCEEDIRRRQHTGMSIGIYSAVISFGNRNK